MTDGAPFDDSDPQALAALLGQHMGALAGRMGIVLTHASREHLRATMPVDGNTQPMGLLHGGASAVLAETLGSVHSFLVAGPGMAVVGLDLSCTHHRGVRDGLVLAESSILSAGRTISATEIRIRDEQGRPVCTSRLTCLLRPA